jgi:hypothetical protein
MTFYRQAELNPLGGRSLLAGDFHVVNRLRAGSLLLQKTTVSLVVKAPYHPAPLVSVFTRTKK